MFKINSNEKFKKVNMAFLLSVSLIIEKVLKGFLPFSYATTNYISSIYFIIIIVLIMSFLPAVHTMGKLRVRGQIIGLCIAASTIYIAINYGAGLLMKNLAANPYDISIKGIFLNIITYFPGIIASIIVRSYSVNFIYKKSLHPTFYLVIITLFFAALDFNYSKIVIISNQQDLFIYLAQEIFPKLSLSFLMTLICLLGGSLPCIWYMCIIKMFQYGFPFLPTLAWVVESVIGIAYNIILMMFMLEEYKMLSHLKPHSKKENVLRLSTIMIFLVMFSWFLVGVFPIYPSVILTGSMEPLIYPGDVVLIEKIMSEEEIYYLKKGDIINFKMNDVTITHRIEEVKTDEAGNISFMTKGDNNYSTDTWTVMPNDLKGTVDKIVPKIGLPVLWSRSSENTKEGVDDYQN